jgi:prevent-host-death family protein
MVHSVSATEARVRFGELLRRVVEDRETIVVERGGEPQVVVLPIAEYLSLRSVGQPADWRAALMTAVSVGEKIACRQAGRSVTPSEEVLAQVREDRDEQLVDLR